ncbi:hypothetical protein M885DRAFT_530737 [Pelagophyceae sp. CCMP2097]|nr:hypothetical protein M885DRAFT_530737 [Pelagophyceae sp. CCMP2097]
MERSTATNKLMSRTTTLDLNSSRAAKKPQQLRPLSREVVKRLHQHHAGPRAKAPPSTTALTIASHAPDFADAKRHAFYRGGGLEAPRTRVVSYSTLPVVRFERRARPAEAATAEAPRAAAKAPTAKQRDFGGGLPSWSPYFVVSGQPSLDTLHTTYEELGSFEKVPFLKELQLFMQKQARQQTLETKRLLSK